MIMEIQDISINDIDCFSEKVVNGKRKIELKERVNNCRCSYCGSKLILRSIISNTTEDGRVEIFCPHCDRIEYGIEPEIYQAAAYYVNELQFDYYPELDDSNRKNRMNIAKVNEILQWGLKNLGLLDQHGFTGDIEMDTALVGQDLNITEEKLVERTGGKNLCQNQLSQ